MSYSTGNLLYFGTTLKCLFLNIILSFQNVSGATKMCYNTTVNKIGKEKTQVSAKEFIFWRKVEEK
jgi:hypothetical protein